jgi:hypothetical protein
VVCLFHQSATLTGNAIDTLCHLLRISSWPGSHEWALGVCFILKIVLMLYWVPVCLHFSGTHFTLGIYTEPRRLTSISHFISWTHPVDQVLIKPVLYDGGLSSDWG